MKIAIHHRPGSFSDRWIEYCKREGIEYKIVNAYDSDIVKQVEDCDALMWHHHHSDIKDIILAKQLLYSLEQAGKVVFPDFNSGWYFDDKLGQKYLLEVIGAPVIPTHVFYDKNNALKWANNTSYPKVWKLRGGASGANVRLIKTKNEAIKYINRSFGRGHSQYNSIEQLKDITKKVSQGRATMTQLAKAIARPAYNMFFGKFKRRVLGKGVGYVMFQDFMPNNKFDNRIIVIGDKAFGVKRLALEGDFKSSEFNGIISDKNEIDIRCVEIAFETAKRMNANSVGFDFIFDENKKPVIAEMGYGFIPKTYKDCQGYWDEQLNWHEADFHPEDWMVEEVIKSINIQTKKSSSSPS
jgi:glutathione synthase/RimK-type ligase-like ATP-grasp enzyme